MQRIDGVQDTDPNARGLLPTLMREAGFAEVAETHVIFTPTGSTSVYRGPTSRSRKEQSDERRRHCGPAAPAFHPRAGAKAGQMSASPSAPEPTSRSKQPT